MRYVERGLSRLGRRPGLAVLSVTSLSFLICAALTWQTGIPVPWIHDEFSYLLAGDTFAHFRLTNPPSPYWKFFEAIHVLQLPTYQAKYPPGQGLCLALGEIVSGYPIVGVWISTALACGAMCWMFMAWMPRRWATLGGFLTCLHPMILKWGHCYWGGSVSLLGAALLFGGVRRVVDGSRLCDAVVASTGAAILILSRPYEGGVACLIAAGFLIARFPRPRLTARLAAALLVPAFVGILWFGYYNYRVTGSPVRLAYAVYEQRYGVVPAFILQPLKPMPPGLTPSMRGLAHDNIIQYRDETGANALPAAVDKLTQIWVTLLLQYNVHAYWMDPFVKLGIWSKTFQLCLLLPLFWLLPAIRRDSWLKMAFVGAWIGNAALLVETWYNPHYASPFAPLAAILVLASLRQLSAWKAGRRRLGRSTQRVVVLLLVGSFIACFRQIVDLGTPPWGKWSAERTAIARRLDAIPEPSIVFVHYSDRHPFGAEWVYNGADLEHGHVIWARDLGVDLDRGLLEHYSGRLAWYCEVDKFPVTLTPIDAKSKVW